MLIVQITYFNIGKKQRGELKWKKDADVDADAIADVDSTITADVVVVDLVTTVFLAVETVAAYGLS